MKEDLEYLKDSIDLVKESPLHVAAEEFRNAVKKIDERDNFEAVQKLQITLKKATKAQYQSSEFQLLLRAIQFKLISSTLLSTAVNVDDDIWFVPLHCLPEKRRKNIEDSLLEGLNIISKGVDKQNFLGKWTYSSKKQDQLGETSIQQNYYQIYTLFYFRPLSCCILPSVLIGVKNDQS